MKIKILALFTVLIAIACVTGCQSVDVTKTAKGFNVPTNPNDVEILMTKPDRAYEELGTIDAVKFKTSDTAKMYNAIRAKAAPLGANAVILTGVGIAQNGKQYAIGVAIVWK
jgi:hypothetical protein